MNNMIVRENRVNGFEKESLLEQLRACLPEILKPRPVLLAYLYGSLAEGCATNLSDIDIALVLEPNCGLDAYQRFLLELEIETEIESCCRFQSLDVRSINDAPLRVQGQVMIRGLLLYSKDEEFRVSYEVFTRRRFFDFQPVLLMMRAAYFSRLEDELKEKELHV
ncbi:MAG: nucleotidyltransferase domain-containing protein [Anaerolineales bacterium]|nr:nucleotidyltransferase domain-containing protein [Anaerolineales bacterium]